MARKSIEDVMNEIEDFLNSCKPAALSSNKIVVPRDEFEDLFGDLKVKIPAEIDRCKKIMRNKEAILMDARKTADEIIAKASEQQKVMVSQTEIMQQANQTAYETIEMARVQANEMLVQAVNEANEIRLGSMQYTNDIMMGIRNYVEATMDAERANYENLIEALNNDYMIANANLEEIQNQIVEFTGNPASVTRPPRMKSASVSQPQEKPAPRQKNSMVDKVKQAVGVREDKAPKVEEKSKQPAVDIPDFIATGEKTIPNEIPLEPKTPVKKQQEAPNVAEHNPVQSGIAAVQAQNASTANNAGQSSVPDTESTAASASNADGTVTRKVKKKIVKKRNPVIHTPQTAQETVAKTVEAATAAKADKTIYKANGVQDRVVTPTEGRVTRGPRVGRGMVEEPAENAGDNNNSSENTRSLGVIDDFEIKEF